MNRGILASALVASAAAIAASNITAYTTFYGAKDNCPPGGDIAYPTLHKEAGGVGSYEDPITYAGDKAATPPGTIIYVFFLKKYFIMEDDCEECDHDWKKKKWHFDLWVGPDAVTPGPNLIACENALTRNEADVEVAPPDSYPVDLRPLFNATTLECIIPAPPCHDTGNTCGNECEIPDAGTCTEIAQELLMNITRFYQLNPKLDCKKELAAGTNVCMGGSCGD